ncbi:MAG: hypothetical protein CME06_05595 [Gemmatimonadetes bacterium]|nr:hypothetical protein [Gemmatimonadota bacterium]
MLTTPVILCSVALSTPPSLATVSHHEIDAILFPDTGRIEVKDSIDLTSSQVETTLYIGSSMQIQSVEESEGRKLDFDVDPSEQPGFSLLRWTGAVSSRIVVRCTADFAPPAEGTEVEREYQAMEIAARIGPSGAYVSPAAGWYPSGAEELARFSVALTVPDGWLSVSEGRRVSETSTNEGTRIEHSADFPVDGVHLCAGPYVRGEAFQGETRVETYFFEADTSLAPTYLQATVGYLERYEKLYGDYPFTRFAVVENFMPTGYGMPTFTLLGQRVVRLPFIVRTSLGHEVLHNWWGNSVYVDQSTGNWCEGLTSYCADYAYKVDLGPAAARRYRKDLLKAYADYVSLERDMPLAEFTGRIDLATRAIGYGKAAMVFHMMRARIGEEAFDRSLRWVAEAHRWRKTSWSDFFDAFEQVSGRSLEGELEQWVERPGAPHISIEHVELIGPVSGSHRIDLEIVQREPVFSIDVPVRITTADHVIDRSVRLDGPSTRVSISVVNRPERVDIDPGYDIFRRMHPAEMEPTLSQFFGDPGRTAEAYGALRSADGAKALVAAISAPDASGEGREQDARAKALLTSKTPYPERLPPEAVYDGSGRLSIDGHVLDPENEACVLALAGPAGPELHIITANPEQLAPLGRKLSHYGRYSFLVFQSGRNVVKGNWSVDYSPLSYGF